MRAICAIVASLVLAGTTFGDTINVPADYPTIQGAIDASSNGDVINIDGGTYNEHSLNPGGRAITIQGTVNSDETLATTIDAQQGGNVFVINSGEGPGTIVANLIITGGDGTNGGGIYCENNSSPTINGCTISDNQAELGGGGINCYANSNPTISGCTISDNTANLYGGGGIMCDNDSTPTITGCTIERNTAIYGGGIYCEYNSNPTITDCTISNNEADFGGGFNCYQSNPTLNDCTIEGNTADINGGGVFCETSSPTISGCTIEDNTAVRGGGIFCKLDSNPSIADCTISRNTANETGGGIYCEFSSPTIATCTILSNDANDGSGIFCNESTPTITDCTIKDNSSLFGGGGIYCLESNPTITGCTITGNTSGYPGGGIYHSPSSNSLLSDTSVCGNAPDQIYGTWTDDGGNTVQEICPVSLGACCIGNEIFCVPDVAEADCLFYGGQWLGEDSNCQDCDPPVEPEVLGACCINGACIPSTAEGCFDGAGSYAGDGVDCEDAGCPETCPGDLTGDNQVTIIDLLFVIEQWGVTCP